MLLGTTKSHTFLCGGWENGRKTRTQLQPKKGRTLRPNPHWTRARNFARKPFDVVCIQCEHSHWDYHRFHLLAFAPARPVWIDPCSCRQIAPPLKPLHRSSSFNEIVPQQLDSGLHELNNFSVITCRKTHLQCDFKSWGCILYEGTFQLFDQIMYQVLKP